MNCLHPSLPNSINIYIDLQRYVYALFFSSDIAQQLIVVYYRTLYFRLTLGLSQELLSIRDSAGRYLCTFLPNALLT